MTVASTRNLSARDPYRLAGRLVGGVAFLVAIFMIMPAFIVMPVSFSDSSILTFPPRNFSLRWYRAFLSIPEWRGAVGYSLLVGLLSAVVSVALGLPASFGLARGRFRGRKLLVAFFVLPLVVPVILMAMAEYFFLSRFDLTGTLTGLVIAHAAIAMPFVLTIMVAAVRDFDRAYEMAALSLGARPIAVFWLVSLPLLRPAVFSAALLGFLASFNEFLVTLFIIGSAGATLPIQFWKGIRFEANPTIAAASTLFIILTIATLLLLELLRWQSRRRHAAPGRSERATTAGQGAA
jgi:ABC-type spermidine/putrescine transport system permease subunit II